MDDNGQTLQLVNVVDEVISEHLFHANHVFASFDLSKFIAQITHFTSGNNKVRVTRLLSLLIQRLAAGDFTLWDGPISCAGLTLPLGCSTTAVGGIQMSSRDTCTALITSTAIIAFWQWRLVNVKVQDTSAILPIAWQGLLVEISQSDCPNPSADAGTYPGNNILQLQ